MSTIWDALNAADGPRRTRRDAYEDRIQHLRSGLEVVRHGLPVGHPFIDLIADCLGRDTGADVAMDAIPDEIELLRDLIKSLPDESERTDA